WFLFVGWDALQHWSGVFGVPVPGGCDHRKVFGCCLVCPPGVFFDLITPSTQPGSILPAGWSTIPIRGGVINILDPSITVRGPTGIIAEHHHPAQTCGEGPPARFHAHQLVIPRPSKDSSQEHVGIWHCCPPYGQLCWNAAAAGHPGQGYLLRDGCVE